MIGALEKLLGGGKGRDRESGGGSKMIIVGELVIFTTAGTPRCCIPFTTDPLSMTDFMLSATDVGSVFVGTIASIENAASRTGGCDGDTVMFLATAMDNFCPRVDDDSATLSIPAMTRDAVLGS